MARPLQVRRGWVDLSRMTLTIGALLVLYRLGLLLDRGVLPGRGVQTRLRVQARLGVQADLVVRAASFSKCGPGLHDSDLVHLQCW